VDGPCRHPARTTSARQNCPLLTESVAMSTLQGRVGWAQGFGA
jgi:hypothetical protein